MLEALLTATSVFVRTIGTALGDLTKVLAASAVTTARLVLPQVSGMIGRFLPVAWRVPKVKLNRQQAALISLPALVGLIAIAVYRWQRPYQVDWSICQNAGRFAGQQAVAHLPRGASICILTPTLSVPFLRLEVENFTRVATRAGLRVAETRTYVAGKPESEQNLVAAYEQLCATRPDAAAVVAFGALPNLNARTTDTTPLKLIGVDIADAAVIEPLLKSGHLLLAIAPRPRTDDDSQDARDQPGGLYTVVLPPP